MLQKLVDKIFQNSADIGNPKLKGSYLYNEEAQIYTIRGAGKNINFEKDEFYFLFNKFDGDFLLTANFEFIGESSSAYRKMGWMIRESSEENATFVAAVVHGNGLTAFQRRPLQGASVTAPHDDIATLNNNCQILQLEKIGMQFIMRAAKVGGSLKIVGSYIIENIPDELLAGVFICSHNEDVVEQARVWNVRIDRPVDGTYDPEKQGWLGCRLETMNVFDGIRKVIFEKTNRFEAPNWIPDGKNLIINMDGLLYKISKNGGKLNVINTDFANKLNNDHGISFDGKLLAISHHSKDAKGESAVYLLPIEGGVPKLLTENTPSYWHGWNPNNTEVVYVAKRKHDEGYNIYKKSILGDDEVALTQVKKGVHVDGCEYSPNGNYIYYNGSQSGTMQIWRMKSDGTEKTQITFSEYNEWFPHISPDGKWMVYISFPADIPVNDHPSYKWVMLQLMPVSGGEPKVIAYLYGGQGTINVPSWSPDSKCIAFVSNSGRG